MQAQAHPARTEPEQPLRTPKSTHELRRNELARQGQKLAERIRSIATLRLVATVGALVLTIGAAFAGWGTAAAFGAGAFAATFVVLVWQHAKVHREADRIAVAA